MLVNSNAQLVSATSVERNVLLAGNVQGTDVEILVDLDGRIRRGKCECSHFRRYGIRNGPCRHMIALRYLSSSQAAVATSRSNGQATLN
jgi:hypothetical protein